MDKRVVPFIKKDTKKGEMEMNSAVATKDTIIAAKACSDVKEDKLLVNLQSTGRRLSSFLGINSENISKAVKDVRKEWK
jgi:hypothetical protein